MSGVYRDVDPTATFGAGSFVWSFTVIEGDVTIGADCVVGSHCFIGRGTKIGDGVRIQTGVFIPRNATIEDGVFIGPNVTFTDDKHPRAGNHNYTAQPPIVRAGASIGAGAVVLPGIEIGENAVIAAGAVVTHDVPADCMVKGIPARV